MHAAFEHAQRNPARSARALGVTRNMVRTLLKRHGLLAAGAIELDGEGESVDDATSSGIPFAPSAA